MSTTYTPEQVLNADAFKLETTATASHIRSARSKMSDHLNIRDFAPYGTLTTEGVDWAPYINGAMAESVKIQQDYTGSVSTEASLSVDLLEGTNFWIYQPLLIPRATILRSGSTNGGGINIGRGVNWLNLGSPFKVPGAFWIMDVQINAFGLSAGGPPLFDFPYDGTNPIFGASDLNMARVGIGDLQTTGLDIRNGSATFVQCNFGAGAFSVPPDNLSLIKISNSSRAWFSDRCFWNANNGRGKSLTGIRIEGARSVYFNGAMSFSDIFKGIHIIPGAGQTCRHVVSAGSIEAQNMNGNVIHVEALAGSLIRNVEITNVGVSSTAGSTYVQNGSGNIGRSKIGVLRSELSASHAVVVENGSLDIAQLDVSGATGDGVRVGNGMSAVNGVRIAGFAGAKFSSAAAGSSGGGNTGYGVNIQSGSHTRLKIDIDAPGNVLGALNMGSTGAEVDISIFEGN